MAKLCSSGNDERRGLTSLQRGLSTAWADVPSALGQAMLLCHQINTERRQESFCRRVKVKELGGKFNPRVFNWNIRNLSQGRSLLLSKYLLLTWQIGLWVPELVTAYYNELMIWDDGLFR